MFFHFTSNGLKRFKSFLNVSQQSQLSETFQTVLYNVKNFLAFIILYLRFIGNSAVSNFSNFRVCGILHTCMICLFYYRAQVPSRSLRDFQTVFRNVVEFNTNNLAVCGEKQSRRVEIKHFYFGRDLSFFRKEKTQILFAFCLKKELLSNGSLIQKLAPENLWKSLSETPFHSSVFLYRFKWLFFLQQKAFPSVLQERCSSFFVC